MANSSAAPLPGDVDKMKKRQKPQLVSARASHFLALVAALTSCLLALPLAANEAAATPANVTVLVMYAQDASVPCFGLTNPNPPNLGNALIKPYFLNGQCTTIRDNLCCGGYDYIESARAWCSAPIARPASYGRGTEEMHDALGCTNGPYENSAYSLSWGPNTCSHYGESLSAYFGSSDSNHVYWVDCWEIDNSTMVQVLLHPSSDPTCTGGWVGFPIQVWSTSISCNTNIISGYSTVVNSINATHFTFTTYSDAYCVQQIKTYTFPLGSCTWFHDAGFNVVFKLGSNFIMNMPRYYNPTLSPTASPTSSFGGEWAVMQGNGAQTISPFTNTELTGVFSEPAEIGQGLHSPSTGRLQVSLSYAAGWYLASFSSTWVDVNSLSVPQIGFCVCLVKNGVQPFACATTTRQYESVHVQGLVYLALSDYVSAFAFLELPVSYGSSVRAFAVGNPDAVTSLALNAVSQATPMFLWQGSASGGSQAVPQSSLPTPVSSLFTAYNTTLEWASLASNASVPVPAPTSNGTIQLPSTTLYLATWALCWNPNSAATSTSYLASGLSLNSSSSAAAASTSAALDWGFAGWWQAPVANQKINSGHGLYTYQASLALLEARVNDTLQVLVQDNVAAAMQLGADNGFVPQFGVVGISSDAAVVSTALGSATISPYQAVELPSLWGASDASLTTKGGSLFFARGSSSVGRIQTHVGGAYRFFLSTIWSGAPGSGACVTALFVTKNGQAPNNVPVANNALATASVSTSDATPRPTMVTGVVKLNAGDSLGVWGYTSCSGGMTVGVPPSPAPTNTSASVWAVVRVSQPDAMASFAPTNAPSSSPSKSPTSLPPTARSPVGPTSPTSPTTPRAPVPPGATPTQFPTYAYRQGDASSPSSTTTIAAAVGGAVGGIFLVAAALAGFVYMGKRNDDGAPNALVGYGAADGGLPPSLPSPNPPNPENLNEFGGAQDSIPVAKVAGESNPPV